MKEIELTQGYTAIVDDEDYERVSQYNWNFHKAHAQSHNFQAPHLPELYLHHFVLGETDMNLRIAFINGDRLDCRKANLKIMTRAEIAQRNTPSKSRNKTSQYKGVYRKRDKWQACIGYQNKVRYLGCFENEDEAAHAYDQAARELYGSWAYLNFPDLPPDRIDHSNLPVRSGLRKRKWGVMTSQFKGVHRRRDGRWFARFTINGEVITRRAKTEMEAAQLYDELILKHLGSNARSNFQSIWAWKRHDKARAAS